MYDMQKHVKPKISSKDAYMVFQLCLYVASINRFTCMFKMGNSPEGMMVLKYTKSINLHL